MSSKTVILLIFLLGVQCLWAGTTGKIAGYVKNQSTGEALIGANVIIEGAGLVQTRYPFFPPPARTRA